MGLFVDPTTVVIGCDLGQRSDPTAVAVVEVVQTQLAWPDPANERIAHWVETPKRMETRFVARRIFRLPLGTPYPAVARRIADLVATLHDHRRRDMHATGGPVLCLDITGLGRPVVDLVREELEVRRLVARLSGVTFTHGQKLTGQIGEREVTCGKAFLVNRLQTLFQSDRIDLPQSSESLAMREELLNFDIKVDPDGDAKFGAFKTGTHDDLVTALGLATLADKPAASWADIGTGPLAAYLAGI
jgi:hypothetical protein